MSGASHPSDVPENAVPLAEILTRWDALVVRWDLDEVERTTLLGGSIGGPVDHVGTYDVGGCERRMRLLIELNDVASIVLGEAGHVRVWLRRPNPGLGGGVPISVMGSSPDWTMWLIHSLRVAM